MCFSDLPEEGAVELHNVGTVTTPHHYIKVHQQLLLLLLIHSGANPLRDTSENRHACFSLTLLITFPFLTLAALTREFISERAMDMN